MKKIVLIAALVAAAMVQPGWAAKRAKSSCMPASAIEAEQAIRYVTDLMVVSSVCQNTTYAEFRLRNKDAIMRYQRALIAHFHGTAGFDRWNTALANESAQRQAGLMAPQLCQKSVALLQQASAFDSKGFQAYVAAQAAADTQVVRCRK